VTEGFGLQTWYVDERPHLPRLRGNGRGTVSAEFTRDGEHVVTASSDGEIRLWDTARNSTTTLLPAGVPVRRAQPSPDGRTVLVLAVDAPPFLLGLDGARHQLGGTPAGDAWFLRDGSLALGGADGVVRICDVLTGRETGAVRCHEGPIQCGALHPGKAWLATGSNDRSFCIVDLAQLRVVFHQQVWQAEAAGDRGHVFGLAFDQQGDRLFGSCEDCRVRVLDLARGAVCRAVVCGPTPGRLVMNRGGDTMFIAGQWGGRLMSCPVERGEEAIYVGNGHKNLFVALELQSRGDLALSASTDGTVHVHDSRTGRLLSEIHASSGGLRDAHFSPDGTRIVTAAADG
jgi:WD40 repeat protein